MQPHTENTLVDRLLRSNVLQAEWVLWFLLVIFGIVVIVVLWKILYFVRNAMLNRKVDAAVDAMLGSGDLDAFRAALTGKTSVEGELLAEAMRHADNGPEAFQGVFDAALLDGKVRMERGLVFLGNVGSNAPFVGLFGTVLGVIKAFNDLSLETKAGAAAVMAGIAEALVATAVGLAVAIPAVLAFNYLQRQVKGVSNRANAMSQRVLVRLRQLQPEG